MYMTFVSDVFFGVGGVLVYFDVCWFGSKYIVNIFGLPERPSSGDLFSFEGPRGLRLLHLLQVRSIPVTNYLQVLELRGLMDSTG